ncbi:MAG: GNAT family N-acetyltransferase [Burkholderiales bacterium]|nr:GNAT family N-acetyltransferase [Burkholderiales bacterium]
MVNTLLLELPQEIRTARLTLRPPRAGDGAVVFEAVLESLPELRRFLASLPWVGGEQSIENSESWCRNSAANFLARKDLPFLMFDTASGEYLGSTGLHRMDWGVPKAEVGYWCRSSMAGRGIVTEAVRAICEYGFEHLRAQRLEIVTDEANVASRRVAERCGFTLEGVLRHERRAPDGSLRDTCIYSRLVGSGAAHPTGESWPSS